MQGKGFERAAALAWFGTVLVLFPVGRGYADMHYVSPDGANEYPYLTPETAAVSIQTAVDAAQYDDTVNVGPGNYVESVTLKEGITLRGAGPAFTTIKRPREAYKVISCAEDVRVEDLSVVFGAEDDPPYSYGIHLDRAPNQVVDNCSISGRFTVAVYCPGPMLGAPAVIMRSTISGAERAVTCEPYCYHVIVDRCTIRDCETAAAAVSHGELFISRCVLVNNRYGLWFGTDGRPAWVECTLIQGSEHAVSGGAWPLTMTSCVIIRNEHAFRFFGGDARFEHCTIAHNSAGFSDLRYPNIAMLNCIVWGNTELGLPLTESGTVTASYSDIQGGYVGQGNISADPRFMNAEAGDYHLSPSSPCIDEGVWGTVIAPRDADGRSRPAYGRLGWEPDMGAYEYYINLVRLDPTAGHATLTWSSFGYSTYDVLFSDDLLTWRLAQAGLRSYNRGFISWIDDGSRTGSPPSLAGRRFYRVLGNP